jgi:predicted RNA-binding Zn-ribbon protein involved in translation (DUF1610 family)
MNDFLCPKCNGQLRIGEYLIFRVSNQKKQNGLILLSPQIGNYTSVKHPSFEVQKEEILEFSCPVCNSCLVSDIHKNLAHVLMHDDAGQLHEVYFSQVTGEHSTFETAGESIRITGEDAGKYTYFKIGEKFKKYL